MSLKTEVTRGVFDPRTYREADPVNWARKRRSDWLAIPGKIHYVRERTVASEEREMGEENKKEEVCREQILEKAAEEINTEGTKQSKAISRNKQRIEFWPRKTRSDITLLRYL